MKEITNSNSILFLLHLFIINIACNL